ncbi:unnamed protein product [Musa banksii]
MQKGVPELGLNEYSWNKGKQACNNNSKFVLFCDTAPNHRGKFAVPRVSVWRWIFLHEHKFRLR